MRRLTLTPDEIRSTDDGSLEFDGVAVPFDVEIVHAGVAESFARGAFDVDELPGTPILYGHNRGEQIGQITTAEDTPVGLAVTGRILAATNRGPDAIALMRDGALRGLSVGFEPLDYKNTATGIQYTRAALHELSTTPLPAYGKHSTVTAVREEAPMQTEAPATDTRDTIDLSPIQDRLDALETRVAERAAPAPQRIPVRETFTRMVSAYGDSRAKIAERADMVSSGNTGLTDTGRTSQEIIDYFDGYRYFLSQVAKVPFPESGIVHRLPKKTQNSLVGQAAEKAEAPSRAILTTVDEFTGEWYKGYLDISYELIRTSSPGAVQIAVEDMLQQAAYEAEVTFVAAVEAASTLFPGGPLDFTDAGTLGAGVRSAVRALRAAAGRGTPKFALTSDSFDSLLLMTDGDGRRLFSTVGATNADGSSDLVADMVSAFGVVFFDSPNSTADIAYNDNSLQASELPPLQLSADNVPNIGRDVGLLGNIITVPRVPAGVLRLASAA